MISQLNRGERDKAHDEIKPLIDRVMEICREHKIPMICAIELDPLSNDQAIMAVAVNINNCRIYTSHMLDLVHLMTNFQEQQNSLMTIKPDETSH